MIKATGLPEYGFHRLAMDFPPMPADQYEALKADIEANGIRQPVLVWQGAIVDGRNRYRAARDLGLGSDGFPVSVLPDDLPEAEVAQLVRSHNLAHRHLSQGQRAMLAAGLGRASHGGASDRGGHLKRSERARVYGVSASMVRRADYVSDNGPPELVEAVFTGTTSLPQAEAEVRAATRLRISPLDWRSEELTAAQGDIKAGRDCLKRIYQSVAGDDVDIVSEVAVADDLLRAAVRRVEAVGSWADDLADGDIELQRDTYQRIIEFERLAIEVISDIRRVEVWAARRWPDDEGC